MLHLDLDDQALHAAFKEMKCFISNTIAGQKRIALLSEDRDAAPERVVFIFNGVRVIVAQFVGQQFSLILAAASV
jgi:hypothetical protein